MVDALVGFDAATIATTHQFCSMVLDSLGVAGDSDSRARLVEDLDDLVKETVDDLYLRAFALDEDGPAFAYDEALKIARRVVDDPQARLEPAGEDRSTTAGRRYAFADVVRKEMELRKRRLGILSYDDLLSQLAKALEGESSPAAERMRRRWQIVLVDEFQDTDPVQWQVLDRAFTGHATMVLIGDPKQAIYAFRGGDVTTYLTASATADTQQTLAVNWRSDAALLSSLQELLRGAALGDERIVVRDVEAHHTESRLVGAGSPFRVRVVRRTDVSKRPGLLMVRQVRPRIATDLAHDIRRLLDSGATFEGRPVRPRDIAVISYRHADLADAQAALADVHVPGVIAGGGSVFATPAAVEWLTLLEALEQPHRSTRVRAAALTCFFGHSATDLDVRGDELTDDVADKLRSWLELFASRGLAAVLEAATVGGLPARVLAEIGGERRLTDLRHIGEALHEAALTERHGLVSLLTWLREQVTEGRAGRGLERTRRLDSDAAAVQLVTIHASKGLEYPVVYLPAVADRHVGDPDLPRYHDADGRRCRNVGDGGAGWAESVRRAQEEDAGEWLRLLYVAVTRAQSQVVCWWSPTKNTVASPLHRMLMRAADTLRSPRPAAGAVRRRGGGAVRAVARPRRPDARAVPAGRARRRRPCHRRWRARRPAVHPHGRRRVAAYVLLLAERRPRRGRRGRGDQRARGGRQGRRGSGRGRGGSRREPSATSIAVPDGEPPRRRDVRVAGARGAGAHRPRGSGPARRAARPHRRATRVVAGRARPRGAGRRAGRGVRLAAGRAGLRAGGGHPARRPPVGPAPRDGLRAAALGWRRPRSWCRGEAVGPGPDPRAAPAGGRPGAGSTPCRCAVRSATSRCGATSPARSTWCCGCPRRTGRGSTSSTTRPTGSARWTSR